VNGASFAHPVISEQNAGAVFPGFEGVFIFQESFSDLTITDTEVPGHPVDIFSLDVQDCSWKPVAAVPWAIVAVRFISG
jgi:hypothetical protein